MRLSLFDDFRDRRGSVTGSERAFIDSLLVVVPAVMGVALSALDPATKLLENVPEGSRILRGATPIILAAAAASIIMARTKLPAPAGMMPKPGAERYAYRFPAATRNAAKALLLPLIILAVYQLASTLPNKLFMRQSVEGYACTADGTPIDDGTIEVRDAFSRLVSSTSGAPDSAGYFIADLNALGAAPATVKLIGSKCGDSVASLSDRQAAPKGCPGEPDEPTKYQRETVRWVFNCAQK